MKEDRNWILGTVLPILVFYAALTLLSPAQAERTPIPNALELRLEALEARVAELEQRPTFRAWPNVDPGICPMPSYPFDWKDIIMPISTFVPYISPQGRIFLNDCGGSK